MRLALLSQLRLRLFIFIGILSCRAYPQGDDEQPVAVPESDNNEPLPPLPCNVAGLIKCFADDLDDWILHLWNFRDNVITISGTACEHHRKMHFCVNYPSCNKSEIISVSRNMTDIILHRRQAGTFLKSYFFSEFSCSTEGQSIVQTHQECLAKYKLNEKALFLSHYIEHNFLKKLGLDHKLVEPSTNEQDEQETVAVVDNNWFCANLTYFATEMFTVAKDECTVRPGYLMCKSLVDAFVNLYPDQLAGCQVDCAKDPESAPLNGVETTTPWTTPWSTTSSTNRWKFYIVNLIISLVTFDVLN